MTTFREKLARMDATLFLQLGDAAKINGTPVRGMFAAPWLEPRLGSLRTGLLEPTLTVREVDAVEVAKGDLADVLGKTYEVMSVEPDGSGLIVLELREVVSPP